MMKLGYRRPTKLDLNLLEQSIRDFGSKQSSSTKPKDPSPQSNDPAHSLSTGKPNIGGTVGDPTLKT